jgi:hypothetical protein
MALDKPLLPANAFTSCLACATDFSGTLELTVVCVGVGGPDALASGVPTPGTNEELREGVNGAEVGTIREGGFTVLVASRIAGSGWL